MADVKKIATRVSYGEALVELANEHDDFVVLDADLAAATQTGKFKAACPDRFFDVGIAESNLMGVAAGIATTGRVAFASTFAMFAAGRAFEQVRNSIGYPHLNVKIGATHAGISVGEDGATHQCCEDIALMRVIPGMTVIVPADDVEARAVTRAAYECDGPVYMRFARLASPVINDPETYKFELGKGIVMREGADVTIIACGLMVGEALEAAEQLAAEGSDAEVINMHTIKPIDADLIVKSATKTGHVVTVEEHSVIGGLGSAVADVLCEQCPTPLKKIGVNADGTPSVSPARVPSSCTSTAWTPPTSWRPPRSSWHKARRGKASLQQPYAIHNRGVLKKDAPVFSTTNKTGPHQARASSGKRAHPNKVQFRPQAWRCCTQVKRSDHLVIAGRAQGYSPNLSAGRRSPCRAKRTAGAPTCPRAIWRVPLCPADGNPKHAMLLMCSKANTAKIQSAHVV